MENSSVFEIQSSSPKKPVYLITPNLNSDHIKSLIKELSSQEIELRIQQQTDSLSDHYGNVPNRTFLIVDNLNGTVVLGSQFSSLRIFVVGYPRKGSNKKNYYCSAPKQVIKRYQYFCNLPQYQHRLYNCSTALSKSRVSSVKTLSVTKINYGERKKSSIISGLGKNEYKEKVDQHSKLFLYKKSDDIKFLKYILKIHANNTIKHKIVASINELEEALSICRGKNHYVLADIQYIEQILNNKSEFLSVIIYKKTSDNKAALQKYANFITQICYNRKQIIGCIRKLGFQVVSLKDIDKSIVKYDNPYAKNDRQTTHNDKLKSKKFLSWANSSKDIKLNQKREISQLKELQSQGHIIINQIPNQIDQQFSVDECQYQNYLRNNPKKRTKFIIPIGQTNFDSQQQRAVSIKIAVKEEKLETNSHNSGQFSVIVMGDVTNSNYKNNHDYIQQKQKDQNQLKIGSNSDKFQKQNRNKDNKIVKKVRRINLKKNQNKFSNSPTNKKINEQNTSQYQTIKVRKVKKFKSHFSNQYKNNQQNTQYKQAVGKNQSNQSLSNQLNIHKDKSLCTIKNNKQQLLVKTPTGRSIKIVGAQPAFFLIQKKRTFSKQSISYKDQKSKSAAKCEITKTNPKVSIIKRKPPLEQQQYYEPKTQRNQPNQNKINADINQNNANISLGNHYDQMFQCQQFRSQSCGSDFKQNNEVHRSYLVVKGNNLEIEYSQERLKKQLSQKNFQGHGFSKPEQLQNICERIMKEKCKQKMKHPSQLNILISKNNLKAMKRDINFILDQQGLAQNLSIIRKKVMKKIQKYSKIRIFVLPKTTIKSEFRREVSICLDNNKLKETLRTYENKIILKIIYITDYYDYIQEIIDIFQ